MPGHKNSSLRPMPISSCVVVLECANMHAYIQPSQDLSRDLCHHEQGTGAPFTQTHRFTGTILEIEMFPGSLEETASRLAEEYKQHGYSVCNETEQSPEILGQTLLMRLRPVTLTVQTYVLTCEPKQDTTYPCIYVGKTMNLTARIIQHSQGTAAHFTRQHRLIKVQSILLCGGSTAEEVVLHETALTLQHMRKHIENYGEDAWDSVRGGRYTALTMGKPWELRT